MKGVNLDLFSPENRVAEKIEEEQQPVPEWEQPGPDWEQVTAWMNRKNPNWKRVEPKMKALAVRKANSARQSLSRAREQRLRGLCREAAEWWPIVAKDPTAIARMPDNFESIPFSPTNKEIFLKMRFPPLFPVLPNKQVSLQRPRIVRSGPRPWPLLTPGPSYEQVKHLFEPPPRASEEKGLKMILIATLEEMRHRLPPESNQRRWFEAMLKNKPPS